MADAEDVALVQANLPEEAEEFDVDESSISILLDSGLSVTKATLASWRSIAAKASTAVDISESGSSRSLSSIFNNAREMIEIWQARVDDEDKKETLDPTGKARARIHTAVRV